MFDENTDNHMGTSGAFGMSADGYVKDSHPGFGSYTWSIGRAMKPNDVLASPTRGRSSSARAARFS